MRISANPGSFVSLLIGICLVLTGPFVRAQMVTGTISGVVTDSTGAVVPGAKIAALNVATGLKRETEANEQGIYTFLALPVGQYKITAERAGFNPATKENVRLEVDRTLRIDIILEVGAVKQSVEVVSSATQLLKPETSDLGQLLNATTVEDLPISGREFWRLALLSPGVAPGPSYRTGPALGWRSLNVNGQREEGNLFLLDGLENREMDLNQDQNPPNLESIREFVVHTSTYSAVLGAAAGAIVSVESKSGSNDFHGSLFEYSRNDAMDAANFFANRLGLEKNSLRFNQFGGSVGGPIIRNKTFFFGEYQGDRISRGSINTITVPTLARRRGDFSDLLAGPNPIQLINPRTFTPIQGNIIDPTVMDPPAAALAQLYPEPNLPGTRLNYAKILVNGLRRDSFSVKVDHVLSKDTLSGRFYFLNHETTKPVIFGKTLGGPPFLGGTDSSRRYSFHASHVHMFSPSLFNDLRMGVSYGNRDLINSDFNDDLGGQFGIPNITINDLTRGLPWILFVGGGATAETQPDFIGSSLVTPQFLGFLNYQVRDSVSLVRGRHRIQVGGDFIRRQWNLFQSWFPRGFYIYLGLSSLLSSGQVVPGSAFADFLLGTPLRLQRDFLPGSRGMRSFVFASFLQDDIKVNPRLTVNLGLRYDLFPPWLEVHDRQSNFDPQTGTIIPAPVPGFGRRLVQTDKNNFSPRIGFSYALTEDNKTILRSGFALAYFDIANASGTFTKQIYNPPTYYMQVGPFFPFAPPLSAGFPIQPPPSVKAPTGVLVFQPTDNVTSYSEQWNLNLERELPRNIVVEVGYVGTRSVHLPALINLNQPFLDASGNRRRLFGDAITAVKTWATISSSHYHALQIKAERRLSHGLQFLVAYTYSKSIDDQSLGLVGSITDETAPQNVFNRRAERGLSAFDVRNRFTLGYIWQIPSFGHAGKKNWFMKNVVSGWQLGGITTLQSGQPITPILSGGAACPVNPMFCDPRVTDIGSLRPNVVGNPNLPQGMRTVDRWFNVNAFDTTFPGQPHDEGTFGNAGRSILVGPGLATADQSIFKEVLSREKLKIQFRAEAFNIFNRVNLDPPIRTVDLDGGRILTAQPGREVQLALKILF